MKKMEKVDDTKIKNFYYQKPGEGNGNPLWYFCLENPMDRGSWWATVHGHVCQVTSVVSNSDPMDSTCQAALSMGFSKQEYWSELPCSCPGDLPNSEIEPTSLMSPALAGGFFTTNTTWEALHEVAKEIELSN